MYIYVYPLSRNPPQVQADKWITALGEIEDDPCTILSLYPPPTHPQAPRAVHSANNPEAGPS